ncbi:MAG: hypothetical protein PVI86_17410 [Phycisphaerae bacterium]|jgi:hypothetical protein
MALAAPLSAGPETVTIAYGTDACNFGWGFEAFGGVVLNDAGDVAYLADLDVPNTNTDTAVYLSTGDCRIILAKEGSPIPADTPGGNGFYEDVLEVATHAELAINDAGQVAFWSTVKFIPSPADPDGEAILLFDGETTKLIARTPEAPPDGNGSYEWFSEFVGLTESGDVIFRAYITDVDPSISGSGGIFFSSLSGARGTREVTRFVRAGDMVSPSPQPIVLFYGVADARFNDAGGIAHTVPLAEPDGRTVVYFASGAGGPTPPSIIFRGGDFGNWDFSGLYMDGVHLDPAVNNLGDVAFTTGVGGGSFSTSPYAIFRNRTSSFATLIAITDQPSPDGNGTLRALTRPRINDRLQVAFEATFWNSDHFPDDDSGIFLTINGVPTIVAREMDAAPRPGTRYGDLVDAPFALNHAGQLAFQADIVGDEQGQGIFLSDGTETVLIAHTGDLLEGQAIAELEFGGGASRQRTGLNVHGQVAYRAKLETGEEVVALTTPDIHWRRDPNGGGQFLRSWDYAGNWRLGIQPAAVHNVYLDYPAPFTTIGGPLDDVTVKSLTIGEGDHRVVLDLQIGATLSVLRDVVNAASNSLSFAVLGGEDPQGARLVAEGDVALSGSLGVFAPIGGEPLAGQSYELIRSESGVISGALTYTGPHLVEQTSTRLAMTFVPVAGDTSAVESFTQCMEGPAAGPDPPDWLSLGGCLAAFDDDNDTDVDLADYAALDRLVTEP